VSKRSKSEEVLTKRGERREDEKESPPTHEHKKGALRGKPRERPERRKRTGQAWEREGRKKSLTGLRRNRPKSKDPHDRKRPPHGKKKGLHPARRKVGGGGERCLGEERLAKPDQKGGGKGGSRPIRETGGNLGQ